VRFDDRLRTVLAQPAADAHDRAVRWRQLVELVARSGMDSDPDLVARAIAAIRADSSAVDERVRTAAALAVAPLQLPVELVAGFAADKLSIAAPVLASARLTASEWNAVAASASDECRAFIATIRSEPANTPEPSKDPEPAPRPEPQQQQPQGQPVPSISEVVARIERLRQQRESGPASSAASTAGDEAPRLFKWECNESGEIDWVEGAPRGALVGQSIAQHGLGAGVDATVERAFAARAPFHDGLLELPCDGKVGGPWKISGIPAFERSSGRFSGYRGIAERPAGAELAAPSADPDSLRELAHEIKTPLNAIIGFAEMIAGEYLGPAERPYRDRASEIVAQARLLLDAVEDVDFAARLRSRSHSAEAAELSDALALSWESLQEQAGLRGVRVSVSGSEGSVRCALDLQLAHRLVERLGVAVIASAAEGESLIFRIGSEGDCCILAVTSPAALRNLDLSPERNRRAGDAASLPLRLVMGLARTAGGELAVTAGELVLRLPRA